MPFNLSTVLSVSIYCCCSESPPSLSSEIDIYDPIRSAKKDEVKKLPGLRGKSPKFKHYSGYLDADDQRPGEKFLHYWFVESQSNPLSDPLVLWLGSGEPGCSNVIGLLTELGPFRIETNKIMTTTTMEATTNQRQQQRCKINLHLNQFAWNRHANILFMDSPTGVGYSYSLNNELLANDDTATKQNYLGIKSFMRKFPQFKLNPLYLIGRFWAGVHLPLLAIQLDTDSTINLKGVAVGNGYLDVTKNDEAIFFSAYYRGIISETVWQELSTYCCFSKPPTRGQCNFWPPNNQACVRAMTDASSQIFNAGVNVYNINQNCMDSVKSVASSDNSSSIIINDQNIAIAKKKNTTFGAFKASKAKSKASTTKQVSNDTGGTSCDTSCNGYTTLNNYMNLARVRESLHIPNELNVQFGACNKTVNDLYDMKYPLDPEGMAQQVKQLLESKRNLKLLFYSGDADLACPLIGSRWFVDDLGAPTREEYGPWYLDDQVAGFRKVYEGVSFMTIKGAGQMVAADRPNEALEMFERYFLELDTIRVS